MILSFNLSKKFNAVFAGFASKADIAVHATDAEVWRHVAYTPTVTAIIVGFEFFSNSLLKTIVRALYTGHTVRLYDFTNGQTMRLTPLGAWPKYQIGHIKGKVVKILPNESVFNTVVAYDDHGKPVIDPVLQYLRLWQKENNIFCSKLWASLPGDFGFLVLERERLEASERIRKTYESVLDRAVLLGLLDPEEVCPHLSEASLPTLIYLYELDPPDPDDNTSELRLYVQALSYLRYGILPSRVPSPSWPPVLNDDVLDILS